MPAILTKYPGPTLRGEEVYPEVGIEGDNQTFVRDDFLKQVGGKLVVARVGDGIVDATTPIIGVARSDARNAVNPGQPATGEVTNLNAPIRDCSFVKPEAFADFVLPLYDANAANTTIAAMVQGQTCVLGYHGGIWTADVGTVANPNLELLDFLPAQSSAETYAYGFFRLMREGRVIK